MISIGFVEIDGRGKHLDEDRIHNVGHSNPRETLNRRLATLI